MTDTLVQVRRHGLALGIDWPEGLSYQERVRSLRHEVPEHAALLAFAVRALRGAGYLALDGAATDETIHWAMDAKGIDVDEAVGKLKQIRRDDGDLGPSQSEGAGAAFDKATEAGVDGGLKSA